MENHSSRKMATDTDFENFKKQSSICLGVIDEPDYKKFHDHLCKTLYYGKHPSTDRPSMALTELAMDITLASAPRELGRVDMFQASSMSRRACMSPCSMMLGLLYIKRLKKKNPEYLQKITSSDLFFISMMLASKYVYDEGVEEEVFNDEWAESAKMDQDDLNELELDFLTAIDWELFVHPSDFYNVLHEVERRIALRKGWEHGWFSYTDIMIITSPSNFRDMFDSLGKEVFKVLIVCSLAYVTAVLTMAMSVIMLTHISATVHLLGSKPPLTVNVSSIVRPEILPVEPSNETLGFGAQEDAVMDLSSENHFSVEHPELTDQYSDPFALDHVLPQLWAMLTLKEKFVDFVCSLRNRVFGSVRHRRNHNPACDVNCCPPFDGGHAGGLNHLANSAQKHCSSACIRHKDTEDVKSFQRSFGPMKVCCKKCILSREAANSDRPALVDNAIYQTYLNSCCVYCEKWMTGIMKRVLRSSGKRMLSLNDGISGDLGVFTEDGTEEDLDRDAILSPWKQPLNEGHDESLTAQCRHYNVGEEKLSLASGLLIDSVPDVVHLFATQAVKPILVSN